MPVLFGPASLDIYQPSGPVLPGGGCVNIAYHWRQLGVPGSLLTRIGDDRPQLFLDFFDDHDIAYQADTITVPGQTAAIEITIRPDGQPWMDHFVPGVWRDLQLSKKEEALLAQSEMIHMVLVEPVIRELVRLGEQLQRPFISADFLDFRHLTLERLEQLLPLIDLAFLGWPGRSNDPLLPGIIDLFATYKKRLVVTMGARSVWVIDARQGRQPRRFPVRPVAVRGTTIGCGDAFAAHFLAAYWPHQQIDEAVTAGMAAGAAATRWRYPLPDSAYKFA
ncbi:MAG: carbohydrate kinase family protein [Ardenticatenaceae bacterium]|nr:carbohydrate kinase family protein [Ardenticatenaceae bacterium]